MEKNNKNNSPTAPSTIAGDIESFHNETIERLEKPNLIYFKKWRRSRFFGMAIGGSLILIGAILFLYVIPSGADSVDASIRKLEEGASSQGERISNAAGGIQSGLGMMALLVLSGGAALIGSMILLASGIKLLIGPPEAGKSPEESVRKFYKKVIYYPAGLDALMFGGERAAKIEAFTFLLNRAQREMGELEDFIRYWDKVADDMRIHVVTRNRKEITGYGITTCSARIDKIEVQSTVSNKAVFEAIIVYEAYYTNQNANPSGKNVESDPFKVTGALECIGGRWYLASGLWKPEGEQAMDVNRP